MLPIHQIHRLVRPAGLIRSALTYSLLRDEEGLYVICTGRSAHPTPLFAEYTRDHHLASAIQSIFLPAIEATEADIQKGKQRELASTKGSFFFKLSEIEEIKISQSLLKGEYLSLKARGEKLVFVFHRTRLSEVSEFVESIKY
jgi:hypothetical protein